MDNSLDFDRNTGGLMKTMGAEKCGRNGIKMVVYLQLDQQKWAQKMEELPSHQLCPPLRPRVGMIQFLPGIRSFWISRCGLCSDLQSRQRPPKHRGVTIGGSENRLPKW